MPEPIKVIQCTKAAEVFDILNITNPIWKGLDPDMWAFRGQRNAEWGLIPRAFRAGINLSFSDANIIGPIADYEEQIRCESKLLWGFVQYANKVGLALPEGGPSALDRISWEVPDYPNSMHTRWPNPESLPLLAIAQHHGVPTRLLDFTYRPLHALFFAAFDSFEHALDSDAIAVWGIDLRLKEKAWELGKIFTIDTVSVRKHSNPFLNAQDGLFLYEIAVSRLIDPEKRDLARSIDSYFSEMKDRGSEILHPDEQAQFEEIKKLQPVVIKVEIQVSLVKEVLRELSRHHVTLASLMPSYNHVVKWLEFKRDCFGGEI